MHTVHSDSVTGFKARWYDRLVGALGVERVYRKAIELLAPKAHERILDVGCGTGTFLKLLKREAGVSLHLLGVDASEDMLAVAQSGMSEGIVFHCGDAAFLPFPESSCDAAVSILAFHHMPTGVKVRAIQNISRIVKPGGRFVILDLCRPTGGWWGSVAEFWFTFHSHTRGNWAFVRNELARWGFARRTEGTVRGVVGYLVADRTEN